MPAEIPPINKILLLLLLLLVCDVAGVAAKLVVGGDGLGINVDSDFFAVDVLGNGFGDVDV